MKKRGDDDAVAGTTRELVAPSDLWAAFDGQLVALFDKTKEAEKSYVQGRGMSLASIAVGSAMLRLSKVRVTEKYDHAIYVCWHTLAALSGGIRSGRNKRVRVRVIGCATRTRR